MYELMLVTVTKDYQNPKELLIKMDIELFHDMWAGIPPHTPRDNILEILKPNIILVAAPRALRSRCAR